MPGTKKKKKRPVIYLLDIITSVHIPFRPTWVPILFHLFSSCMIMWSGAIYSTSLRPQGCPWPINQWSLNNELNTAGENHTIYKLEPVQILCLQDHLDPWGCLIMNHLASSHSPFSMTISTLQSLLKLGTFPDCLLPLPAYQRRAGNEKM